MRRLCIYFAGSPPNPTLGHPPRYGGFRANPNGKEIQMKRLTDKQRELVNRLFNQIADQTGHDPRNLAPLDLLHKLIWQEITARDDEDWKQLIEYDKQKKRKGK